ncbi:MAG: efflux RND transporter periplasmic adaptor subunit [Candidatus Paceibacterota bacterium]|jgi:HlyD family secretion protein
MKKIFSIFSKPFKKHKIISSISLIVIFIGVFFLIKGLGGTAKATTQYTTEAAEKGSIVSSVSGSGQIEVSSQVDLKAKASGDITFLGIKNGQQVKKGATLASIDTKDARQSIRDAEISLENAKISYDKLIAPADDLTILQAENSLEQAKENKVTSETNLEKSYEDTFGNISDSFLVLPSVITKLDNVLHGYDIGQAELTVIDSKQNNSVYIDTINPEDRTTIENLVTRAENSYKTIRESYDQNLVDYTALNRYSDNEKIQVLLDKTVETVKKMSEAIKDLINTLDYWMDYRTDKEMSVFATVTAYRSDLSSYSSKVGGYVSSLISNQNNIISAKQQIINYERTIEEKTESLADLKAGADELDIRSQKLSLEQKQVALQNAKDKLADYYVYAPFDGTITDIVPTLGEEVSSGATIATLMTDQKIAVITLNEVDVTKVKVNQKAILTFDALSDLSITGSVTNIDASGTVNQGVVSYDVQIILDVNNENIRPGMSTSVSIITENKSNVLLVSNSAVKTQGSSYYVEIMEKDQTAPTRKTVEIGISNDTQTEIISGISENDKVVIKTSASTSNSNTSSSSSNSSSSKNNNTDRGGPGGAGELMRIF